MYKKQKRTCPNNRGKKSCHRNQEPSKHLCKSFPVRATDEQSYALKFSKSDVPPHIIIESRIASGSLFQNETPELTGKLSPQKEYCHISISDNGIGFDPRYKEQIFEVFQRLYGQDEYPGTGIGLAIVKKIVDNHSGIVTATSELGKGATFDIYIPAL